MIKVFASGALLFCLGFLPGWGSDDESVPEKITFTKSAIISAYDTGTTVCIDDTDYGVALTHANHGTLALWRLLPDETAMTFTSIDNIWVYYFGPITQTDNPDDLAISVSICLLPFPEASMDQDTSVEETASSDSSFSPTESDDE